MEKGFTYQRLSKGLLGSNTYLVWTPEKEAAVIDAGNAPAAVEQVVREQNLRVRYLLLTHVHFDHIYYLEELRRQYQDAVVVCHAADQNAFGDASANASLLFGSAHTFSPADLLVQEGSLLPLGNRQLRIVSTPGHTPGSICIQADAFLFTGDTLFYDGFGRTDLGMGDVRAMKESIGRLYQMDPALTVLPGHGTATTIGRESASNPYLEW